MPASVSLRKDFSAEELRRLAKNATSVSQGRRLLSLAAVLDVFEVGALLPRRLGARRGGQVRPFVCGPTIASCAASY
jgi:hypothetical protein